MKIKIEIVLLPIFMLLMLAGCKEKSVDNGLPPIPEASSHGSSQPNQGKEESITPKPSDVKETNDNAGYPADDGRIIDAFYESEDELHGSGRLLEVGEFEKYLEIPVADVLDMFGETLGGEKSIGDVAQNNLNEIDNRRTIVLKFDGLSIYFRSRTSAEKDTRSIADYYSFDMQVTKNVKPFVKDIKIGDSEKHVIETFYNENNVIRELVKEKKPLIDYIETLNQNMETGEKSIGLYSIILEGQPLEGRLYIDVDKYYDQENIVPGGYNIAYTGVPLRTILDIAIKDGKVFSYKIHLE